MTKKATKKPAKKTARKTASKKAALKPAARRAAKKYAPPSMPRMPSGYSRQSSGLIVPTKGVVPAGKMAEGFTRARNEIQSFLQEVIDTATQDFEISEIEVAASFSADGKFLGFGVGGEASITIRIRPSES